MAVRKLAPDSEREKWGARKGRFSPGVGVTEAFIESTTVGSDQDLPLSRLTLWRIPRPTWYLRAEYDPFAKKQYYSSTIPVESIEELCESVSWAGFAYVLAL